MGVGENEATVLWRIGALERQFKDLDIEKADVKDLNALTEEVKGLRKALIAFAFSVTGSALVFAFSVLALVK